MSIEVLLIPLGIAAVVAAREALRSDENKNLKATRVTDPNIIVETLERLGAAVTVHSPDEVRATSRWGQLTFRRSGQIFLARVDGKPEETTADMLTEFDSAVGRVMQNRTAQLVAERAEALGFRLIEQHEDDGTLNYVFEEA